MIWLAVFLRSTIFHGCFYFFSAIFFILCMPLIFAPRKWLLAARHFWIRTIEFLLLILCGVRVDIKGGEHIPEGGAIVAVKHQTVWETLGLIPELPDPCFVLKSELRKLPLFGLYLERTGQIFVDRNTGARAMLRAAALIETATKQARQVIIFPEGTRRAPGLPPDYKRGIVHFYRHCHSPLVPVAHNAGLFWPARGFMICPGVISVRFLSPIPPGQPIEPFFSTLIGRIEGETNALIEDVAANGSGMAARRAREALERQSLPRGDDGNNQTDDIAN